MSQVKFNATMMIAVLALGAGFLGWVLPGRPAFTCNGTFSSELGRCEEGHFTATVGAGGITGGGSATFPVPFTNTPNASEVSFSIKGAPTGLTLSNTVSFFADNDTVNWVIPVVEAEFPNNVTEVFVDSSSFNSMTLWVRINGFGPPSSFIEARYENVAGQTLGYGQKICSSGGTLLVDGSDNGITDLSGTGGFYNLAVTCSITPHQPMIISLWGGGGDGLTPVIIAGAGVTFYNTFQSATLYLTGVTKTVLSVGVSRGVASVTGSSYTIEWKVWALAG